MAIRIGNQTCGHLPGAIPYEFALTNQFDAYEWFSDKKGISGWCETDTTPVSRREIRKMGLDRGMLFSVHAPCVADPTTQRGREMLRVSIEFGHEIGAKVVNFHLFAAHATRRYAEAMIPLLIEAEKAGLILTLENTPEIGPDYVNAIFGVLGTMPEATDRVGMCFDMGHANLHLATRHRFVDYVDLLGDHVPILHWHAHENWGDRDSHLTLFSGPSNKDDRGLRALIRRLLHRGFDGAIILEQWPSPPEMLIHARSRLRTLIAEVSREETRIATRVA